MQVDYVEKAGLSMGYWSPERKLGGEGRGSGAFFRDDLRNKYSKK